MTISSGERKNMLPLINGVEPHSVYGSSSHEFTSDSERNFEIIFSAIGNSEAKCLTLLCLSDSYPTLRPDLRSRFIRESGSVWITGEGLQDNYCKQSLIPFGLVERVQFWDSNSVRFRTGFRLTKLGKNIRPIAAYLLKSFANMPLSMKEVFSNTTAGTGSSRPAVTRARTLEMLRDNQLSDLSAIDIASVLNVRGHVVSRHLEDMAEKGLVEFESLGSERHNVFIHNSHEEVVQIRPNTLKGKIIALAREMGQVDASNLTDLLKNHFPNTKEESLKNYISRLLWVLAREGVFETPKFRVLETMSTAKITSLGVRVVDIILPIRNVLSGNDQLLSSWETIDWRQYASTIRRHRESSGLTHTKPFDEQEAEVLAFVRQKPGARPKDLNGLFRNKINGSQVLRRLVDQKLVYKVRDGNKSKYFVLNSTNPS